MHNIKVGLGDRKLEELCLECGWKTTKPAISFEPIHRDTEGRFEKPISIKIDPKRIDPDRVREFKKLSGSIDHKEAVVVVLAHELGHFHNYHYAEGKTKHIEQFLDIYRKIGLFLMVTSMAMLAIENYYLNIFSLVLSFVTFYIFVYTLPALNEQNADVFMNNLLANQRDLLLNCVQIDTPVGQVLNGQ